MTRYYSDDRTKMIDDAPVLVAAAAYEVENVGDSYDGHHVGIFENGEDAMNWLKYGTPSPVKITVRQVR